MISNHVLFLMAQVKNNRTLYQFLKTLVLENFAYLQRERRRQVTYFLLS